MVILIICLLIVVAIIHDSSRNNADPLDRLIDDQEYYDIFDDDQVLQKWRIKDSFC